jgi:hypothetical protein
MIVSSPSVYHELRNFSAVTGANSIWVVYLLFFFVHLLLFYNWQEIFTVPLFLDRFSIEIT